MLPYRPERLSEGEMCRRARDYFEELNRRRSVRFFASDPVPRELIEIAIRTQSAAPGMGELGAFGQTEERPIAFRQLTGL